MRTIMRLLATMAALLVVDVAADHDMNGAAGGYDPNEEAPTTMLDWFYSFKSIVQTTPVATGFVADATNTT